MRRSPTDGTSSQWPRNPRRPPPAPSLPTGVRSPLGAIVADVARAGTAQWAESATRSLSESGHRAGGARQAVVEMLAKQSCCVSAQEIAEGLRKEGTNVGLASV